MQLSLLRSIYGDGAAEQVGRYAAALDVFRTAYGPGEALIFRAPGRVNLIGEHTDYNHGYVLPVALDRDILLLARPRPDPAVNLVNVESSYAAVSFTISLAIPSAAAGHWSNYIRGPAQAMAQHLGRDLCGFDGLISAAAPFGVPRAAGLSSSSALTVAGAVALAHINDWRPEKTRLAQFCSEAEWYVGTRGGIMDQFIALLAQRGQGLFLDCRPDAEGRYTTSPAPLPADYRILIANSGVHHDNVRGGFNQRVAECRAGVALLRSRHGDITHLRDVQDAPWAQLDPHLPETITVAELEQRGIRLGDLPGLAADLSLRVKARCRHVWTENGRVLAALAAMRGGDATALGRLLDQAHASARDDYEISCPEIEILVQAAHEVDGVAGARLTGAGWGGCIVALVRADAVSDFETHVGRRYAAETGRQASIFACRAGAGAGWVGRGPN
jgi:galactokinase